RRARRSRDDPKNGADEIARGFTPRILARALSSLAPARSFLVTRPLPPPARSPHFLLDPRTPRYDSACRTRHGATTRSWGDHAGNNRCERDRGGAAALRCDRSHARHRGEGDSGPRRLSSFPGPHRDGLARPAPGSVRACHGTASEPRHAAKRYAPRGKP